MPDLATARRICTANQVIRIISEHGRHFYSLNSDRRTPLPEAENRISRFEFDGRGRLWFIDKYTQKRIFVHFEPAWRSRWRGFSDGGTLRNVAERLRDYILRGDTDILRYFGPWPEWSCGGDPWGYGADMEIVRQRVSELIAGCREPKQEAAC